VRTNCIALPNVKSLTATGGATRIQRTSLNIHGSAATGIAAPVAAGHRGIVTETDRGQRRIGIGCRYGFALLPPSSLPARDHPVRDLGSPRPSNRAHLGRDRKFADSPLEETVTSEPVSVFPDQRQNTAKFVDLRLTRRETAPFLEVYHWVKSHFPGVAEQGDFYIRSEKSKGLIGKLIADQGKQC
jgi:hypothetical protein